MAERPAKPETIPRKRALVSCDRCKTRRGRCIRQNPDEPCSDCKINGVRCESKLPRKQRVYGSVESLSLRFRALESLVKGLYPGQNIQDTENLFRIAAEQNITMPATDDFTPTEIFKHQEQATRSSLQPSESTLPGGTVSPTLVSKRPNPFMDTKFPQPIEKLIPTLNGVPHYFGPSSSFKLAMTIRNLVARCNATKSGRSLLQHSSTARSDRTDPPSKGCTPRSTGSSQDGQRSETNTPSDGSGSHKRSRTDVDLLSHGASIDAGAAVTIAELLPTRPVADALVSAYFDHVHLIFPLFHRQMFQSRYEETWKRMHVTLHDNEETGWLCCLALVFAFGAQALDNYDPKEASALQSKSLGFVRSYFRRLVSTTSLVDVQALLLLQLYDHNVGKRNSSWLLIGTAARMAISMGMHREGTYAELDPLERNIRRLVWWMLYIFEKILCSYLGRPSAIDDAEISTCIPDETMLDNKDLPPKMLEKSIEAARLSYQIRRRVYFHDGSPEERTVPIHLAHELLQELDAWYKTIPAHLQVSSTTLPGHKRGALLVHIYYFYIRSLVTRNFLTQRVERHICRLEGKLIDDAAYQRKIQSLSEDCIVSAAKCLENLNMLAELKLLNGVSWLDVFYVFHAVLIVCADFLARPKDQLDSVEDTKRKASVRTILQSTRVIKLAPTYNILSQFAFQFAYICGATDVPYTSYQAAGERNILSPIPQMTPFTGPIAGHGMETALAENSDMTNDWYQNESANVLWDWFDLDSQGSVPMDNPHPVLSGNGAGLAVVGDFNAWNSKI